MTPHEIERVIDTWDPGAGDLPDEVALAMDGDDALRARFDARFAQWDAGEDPVVPPADLGARMLPVAANRPFRWGRWVAPTIGIAAAALCAIGGSVSVVGAGLSATFSSTATHIGTDATVTLQRPPDLPFALAPAPAPAGPTDRTRGLENREIAGNKNELKQLEVLGYYSDGDKSDAHAGMDLPATGDGFVDAGVRGFEDPRSDALSTFSIDVDRGSYSFARRRLREGFLPDPSGVRTEEFVNALAYAYPQPDEGPFTVQFEASPGPFAGTDTIVRIGLQGRAVAARKPVHLTFLVDTSGSMQGPDRLPLVKQALTLLVGELQDGDTVAIVAYAGAAGIVLEPTPATEKRRILGALDGLAAGGSTAMGQGIELAYRLATQALREGETSRVVIASDGDANVGTTSVGALTELIRGHADQGVTLTTLGFGQGNYQDHRMEQLANDGDGNYFYVDSIEEARRVFVDELASTLEVIARDVKVQVEWNADAVERYRLIGYDNRAIADRDFRNDRVDAGEIGAGHTVTALYQVTLREGSADPIATVRLRAKPPGEDAPATERTFTLPRGAVQPSFEEASADHRMAIATGAFAERLRASPYVVGVSYAQIGRLLERSARPGHAEDLELVELAKRAAVLDPDPG